MRIEELKDKIIVANKAYREGKPIMDDLEFDDLLERYQREVSEEEYSEFRDSLHEISGKVKHPFVMGSLNKLKTEEPESIREFFREYIKGDLNVSAKVDGISCRLHYENGQLVSASTRGDGTFGTDLTEKIKYVKNVPLMLKCQDAVDIRGELVIFKSDFEKMEGFANPRNACAGIMNRLDWNISDVSNVSLVCYTVLGPKLSKREQFEFLESEEFFTAWHADYAHDDITTDEFINGLVGFATQDFEYGTDGLVVCDSEYHNEEKYRPDACVAVKINQLVARTRIVDIDWGSPSKNGQLVPVAVLEPVDLGGSTISRVTCNNLDYMEEFKLKYGSEVEITKSGDIIPKITKLISNEGATDIELPTECPCCGSKLVRDGVNLRCMNKSCKDQVITQIEMFIKKLGVKCCSFATLDNFGIHSFDGLIAFRPDKKYKMQVKLYSELSSKVFTRSKQDLLAATNFCDLGEKLINKVVDFYGFENIERGSYVGLPDGIGEITLQKFKDSFLENLSIVNKFINDSRYSHSEAILDKPDEKKKYIGSVCFTGKLFTMTRSEASKRAESAGYEVKGGVAKGLTYLVTNDTESGSSKNKKAKALGIKVINEEEFKKLVDNNSVDLSTL